LAVCGMEFLYLTLLFLTQIESAEYSFPPWITGGAKSLIRRILDPNPDTVS